MAIQGRPKVTFYKVIMTLQVDIKFHTFLIKFWYLSYVSDYRGKSLPGAPIVQWETEVDLICPFSVKPLISSHGQNCRPLRWSLEKTPDASNDHLNRCVLEIKRTKITPRFALLIWYLWEWYWHNIAYLSINIIIFISTKHIRLAV